MLEIQGVKMKVLLLSCLLSLSGGVMAQSQAEVSSALDKMKESGMFTPAQIELAKKQLLGMDKDKYNSLLENAKKKANDPEVKKKAMEVYQKQQSNTAGE
jgi:hypothetical protein